MNENISSGSPEVRITTPLVERILVPKYPKKMENGKLVNDTDHPTLGRVYVQGKVPGKEYSAVPPTDWNQIVDFDRANHLNIQGKEVALSDFLLRNPKSLLRLAHEKGFISQKDINEEVAVLDKDRKVKTDGDKMLTQRPYSFLKITTEGNLVIPKNLTAEQVQNILILVYDKTVNTTDFKYRPKENGLQTILLEEITQKYRDFKEAGDVSKESRDPSSLFTEEPILQALNVACRKAIDSRLKEIAYSKTRILTREGESADERRIQRLSIAEQVASETKNRSWKRVISRLMDLYRKSPDGKVEGMEFTAQMDLFMAQAFDVLVPAENRLEMKKLEMKIEGTLDYQKKADLKEELNRERQMWRMAILRHFKVERILPEGVKVPKISDDLENLAIFTDEEHNKIEKIYRDKIADSIAMLDNENAQNDGFFGIDLTRANIIKTRQLLESLAKSKKGEKKDNKTKRIEGALSTLFTHCSKDITAGGNKGKASKNIDKYIKESGLLTDLSEDQKDLVERIVKDAYKSQVSLELKLRSESVRLGGPEVKPTDVKFGSEIQRAIKGIELFYRRGVNETIEKEDRYKKIGPDGKPMYEEVTDKDNKMYLKATRGPFSDEEYEQAAAVMSQIRKPELTSKDEYEFFNSLSEKEKLALKYLSTISEIGRTDSPLNLSDNLESVYSSSTQDAIDIFISQGALDVRGEDENTEYFINGQKIEDIKVPADFTLSNKVEDYGEKIFEQTVLMGLKTEAGNLTHVAELAKSDPVKAREKLIEALDIKKYYNLAEVLDLGDDIWSEEQLIEAVKGSDKFEVDGKNLTIKNLEVTSNSQLDTLANISDVLRYDVTLTSLGIFLDEGQSKGETSATFKKFKIDNLDVEFEGEITPKIILTLDDCNISMVSASNVDLTLRASRSPKDFLVTGENSKVTLLLPNEKEVEKMAADGSRIQVQDQAIFNLRYMDATSQPVETKTRFVSEADKGKIEIYMIVQDEGKYLLQNVEELEKAEPPTDVESIQDMIERALEDKSNRRDKDEVEEILRPDELIPKEQSSLLTPQQSELVKLLKQNLTSHASRRSALQAADEIITSMSDGPNKEGYKQKLQEIRRTDGGKRSFKSETLEFLNSLLHINLSTPPQSQPLQPESQPKGFLPEEEVRVAPTAVSVKSDDLDLPTFLQPKAVKKRQQAAAEEALRLRYEKEIIERTDQLKQNPQILEEIRKTAGAVEEMARSEINANEGLVKLRKLESKKSGSKDLKKDKKGPPETGLPNLKSILDE